MNVPMCVYCNHSEPEDNDYTSKMWCNVNGEHADITIKTGYCNRFSYYGSSEDRTCKSCAYSHWKNKILICNNLNNSAVKPDGTCQRFSSLRLRREH